MIHLTLEMSDDMYEKLRNGISFGIFGEISISRLKDEFGITVVSVQHTCGDKKND